MYLLNIYYQEWIREYDTLTTEDILGIKKHIIRMNSKPRISVIMPVYNPPLEILDEAIQSVYQQIYPFWELCIADDASTDPEVHAMIRDYVNKDVRIHAVFRKKNGHISAASNSAIELVRNDFIALLDHDDILHPLALYEVAQTINAHPECEVIYSDEDKITKGGRRFDPYFKPEFNYELLLSQNMVSHLGVYRTSSVRKIKGFREGLEGSQDYDLLLRMIEQCQPDKIHHIPRPLYHWRISHQSVAEDVNIKPYATEAGIRALNDHLQRQEINAKVDFVREVVAYRINYALPDPQPSVTIIICAASLSDRLIQNINDLLGQTTYKNYKVNIYLSKSPSAQIPTASHTNWEGKVQIRTYPENDDPLNFSTLNDCIDEISSDYICLLDEGLSGYAPEWLSTLVSQAYQPGIGLVAPKLIYPNGFVYCNGIILLPDLILEHLSQGAEQDDIGYFGWSKLRRGYSALSEKCLLFKRENFSLAGGFEKHFNNFLAACIDLCLKLRMLGLRNIQCPSVELTIPHNLPEQSNNKPDEQIDPLDRAYLTEHWSDWIQYDPAFNPNLTIVEDGKILVSLSPRTDSSRAIN
jgi:glycosyltransferase involved in cell wall biosynthesis